MTQRSFRDIPNIPETEPKDKVINDLIDQLNFLSKNISFQSNFDGQIVKDLVFEAGEEKTIPHNLGIVPMFRTILRQVGNGVISDIPFSWTKNSIVLKNNGAVEVTATVMIVRE